MKAARRRILTIGAVVVLAAAAAVAQDMHEHGGPGGELHHMLKQLNLTSDQHAQVKAILEKEKPAIQPLMEQMRQNHEAMKALQANGTFDEAKTRTLATQNAQTQIELEVAHARIKSQIMQVLTTEQKAKLTEMEASHEGHMKEHMPPPPAEE